MAPEALPVVLSIAGSDSGGGAGIQADLKTITSLGCFPTTAITCVTAQNPDGVTGIQAIDVDMVTQQIHAVCDGFPVAAAKTGMLFSRPIIAAVAKAIRSCGIALLVVDPVMVATSGARLLEDGAVEALCSELIPLATVVTPNLDEAEILCGHPIADHAAMETAAKEISAKFQVACVVKGGHLRNAERRMRNAEHLKDSEFRVPNSEFVVDVLSAGGAVASFEVPRLDGVETHGTGCIFSAALAALLAKGLTLAAAVGGAQETVYRALENALPAGNHRPLFPSPNDH